MTLSRERYTAYGVLLYGSAQNPPGPRDERHAVNNAIHAVSIEVSIGASFCG